MKRTILTCICLAVFHACFVGFSLAGNSCSDRELASIPGQMSAQIYSELGLTQVQQKKIAAVSRDVQNSCMAWHETQLEKRNELLATVEHAMDDGTVSGAEQHGIDRKAINIGKGRSGILKIITGGVQAIDSILTDEQKAILANLHFDLQVPSEVQSALEELQPVLENAVTEYRDTGMIEEGTANALKDAWQNFLDAVCLPGFLEVNMDGRIMEIMIDELRIHEDVLAGTGFDMTLDDLRAAVQEAMENAENGHVSLDDFMSTLENMGELPERLAFLAKFARTSFLEAFMLTPVFNCYIW